jgi:hypothetical protein
MLKILEIQSGDEDQDSPAETMAQFLSACDSIEQLFFSHKWVKSTPGIWNAIRHQKSSLRVFVYHQRETHFHPQSDLLDHSEDDPRQFQLDLSLNILREINNDRSSDQPDLESRWQDIEGWSSDPSSHPLHGFSLEFPGLCCDPAGSLVIARSPRMNRC